MNTQCKRQYTSVMIVPTGVGAAIGGYAGDALPVARALASVVDCLITHPNVIISSCLDIFTILSFVFFLLLIVRNCGNFFRCLMQQCFTGRCKMCFMLKAMH